jgi:hypothetical protein
MKKILAVCIVLIIAISDVNAQNNNPLETNFAKGFKVGFKNGYCYGNQGVDCFYPTPPAAPLPGLYESKDNYQDGYNRGFQVGSDLFKSKKEDNRNPYNPPVNKFNPYVPQISAAETSPEYIEAMRRKRESEAAAYAATGALVFGAIANSNDFYIHYIKVSDEKNYQFSENISSNGLGFGFRVGKKRSVFEYGASFIQDNIVTIIQSYRYYSSSSESKLKWGAHLNYLYNFPVIKNSNKLNLYLGASLNSFFSKDESIGIGGIGGVNFNVLNWLKIDARYEKTTTTNRISSGVLINFNKN